MDSSASCSYVRLHSIASSKVVCAEALSESKQNGEILVRLATGAVLQYPKISLIYE